LKLSAASVAKASFDANHNRTAVAAAIVNEQLVFIGQRFEG
jgi:hypothetical protein